MESVTEKLNAVIDYIENHLADKIEPKQIACIACCSYYDVGRMFSLIANITIADYVRKRRMTLAGQELKYTGASVMDTALKYQYDSPVSFSRAFLNFHGFVPSQARDDGTILKSFPRLIYQIRVKEVLNMTQKDILVINEKEYNASYLGEADMSGWSDYATKREYWRLENVGNDFDGCKKDSEVLPYNNYPPIVIEIGQVFAIDYHRKDGEIERRFYVADGTVWQGLDSTRRILIDK